ncbi:Na(+)/H(+) antiporter subunit G [Aquimixticola soesokkakensis]|uniref:Na(+)/H(+) antiporter subunit G n=1 Tax=Aquimixticola soesokkakensis TaxID=1519096 RepID=A0A1Y5RSZ1_9RHOB|nr:monovalent cation/H(+) antiporter subunit G [Aquimixticola soesokkakensis]SLN24444.1 Na(+)/H(+) antiporter subunit G [Aquimixticola soesokkakensis]
MSQYIAGCLILLGGFFSVSAAIGLLRLPDALTRMHASTKVGTLASLCMLLACAFAFGDLDVFARCVIAVFFLLVTAPVAAHMIGRAALGIDGLAHLEKDHQLPQASATDTPQPLPHEGDARALPKEATPPRG